jgi:hypothetical protein
VKKTLVNTPEHISRVKRFEQLEPLRVILTELESWKDEADKVSLARGRQHLQPNVVTNLPSTSRNAKMVG